MENIHQLFDDGLLSGFGTMLLLFAGYLLLGIIPICLVLYVIYFLLTLPMRRNERARLFIDLIELGLKDGKSPEQTIVGCSASHDRALGVRFHLLAAYIAQGLSFSQALDQVPSFLSPPIKAIFRTGERLGDISKALPAARQLLRDGVSRVRGAINYLVLITFVVTPFTIFIPFVLRVKVMPSFKQVFQGIMEGYELPALTRFVLGENYIFISIQILILVLIWLAVLAYIGGNRLHDWPDDLFPGFADRTTWWFPWRRKRLRRDFSTILAVLLDNGMPESEAVSLAGESTANSIMRRKAAEIISRLKDGMKLPEALRIMDESGEFQWRVSNALRQGKGFSTALAGWHESLDAKAFQLEQATAQITTSALVLINGAIVGCIVIGIFVALIQLINQAVLW